MSGTVFFGWIPAFAAGALLLVNAVSDLRRRQICLLFTLVLGGAGLLWRLAAESPGLLPVAASLLPGAFFLLLAGVSRGGVGAGDGIVLTALGVWAPAETTILSVFFSLAGLSAAAALLSLAGKKKREFPYVPFLLGGYCIARMVV